MSGGPTARLERVDAFLESAEQLSQEQWRSIGLRFLDDEANIREVVVDVLDVVHSVWTGGTRASGGLTTDEYKAAVRQANERSKRIVAGLSDTERIESDITLRKAAGEAMWHAMRALLVYDELADVPSGRDHARTLLAPFAGLAVLPP